MALAVAAPSATTVALAVAAPSATAVALAVAAPIATAVALAVAAKAATAAPAAEPTEASHGDIEKARAADAASPAVVATGSKPTAARMPAAALRKYAAHADRKLAEAVSRSNLSRPRQPSRHLRSRPIPLRAKYLASCTRKKRGYQLHLRCLAAAVAAFAVFS